MLNEQPAAVAIGRSMPLDADEVAVAFHVLALPLRLRIILRLAAGECGVRALTELLRVPQPTVSHHLGVLREFGIVAPRRAAREVFYRLRAPAAVGGIDGVTIDRAQSRIRFAFRPAPTDPKKP